MESGEAASGGAAVGGAGAPVRRVLLVGFMGSGKTTVGRILAEALDWPFVDFDDVVEARAGRSVERIFREMGEEGFRRLEGEVGAELVGREPVVLASGGGWPARRGRMNDLPPGTLSVWLRVAPEEALRRVRQAETVRPLLERPDALEEASRLLREREPFYAMSSLVLDTEDASPRELARAIEERVTT